MNGRDLLNINFKNLKKHKDNGGNEHIKCDKTTNRVVPMCQFRQE
jgi:hypothetical protein